MSMPLQNSQKPNLMNKSVNMNDSSFSKKSTNRTPSR